MDANWLGGLGFAYAGVKISSEKLYKYYNKISMNKSDRYIMWEVYELLVEFFNRICKDPCNEYHFGYRRVRYSASM